MNEEREKTRQQCIEPTEKLQHLLGMCHFYIEYHLALVHVHFSGSAVPYSLVFVASRFVNGFPSP